MALGKDSLHRIMNSQIGIPMLIRESSSYYTTILSSRVSFASISSTAETGETSPVLASALESALWWAVLVSDPSGLVSDRCLGSFCTTNS